MAFSNIFDIQLKRMALGYGLYGVTQETYARYSGLLVSMLKSLYLYIPLITMGLMSREYSSGSIKFLLLFSYHKYADHSWQVFSYDHLCNCINGNPVPIYHIWNIHYSQYERSFCIIRSSRTIFINMRLCRNWTIHVQHHFLPSRCRNGNSLPFLLFKLYRRHWARHRICSRHHLLAIHVRKIPRFFFARYDL